MRLLIFFVFFVLAAGSASAQVSELNQLLNNGGGTYSGRIIQGILLLTVLSLAPGILVTMTCFTRFVIAFSFLRSGLGLQSTPSNLIVISLSLFMTYFVMSPVFEKSWDQGVAPLIENQLSEQEAFLRATEPVKEFMLEFVRPTDLKLFLRYSDEVDAATNKKDLDLKFVVPAFMLSELRKGFEIGFLILLPFLVIDLVVATITMSMGMMMLPPTVVSLPFKILFFVLIDGWGLIVGELLESVFK